VAASGPARASVRMARRCTREEVVSAGRLPEFTARNLNLKKTLFNLKKLFN